MRPGWLIKYQALTTTYFMLDDVDSGVQGQQCITLPFVHLVKGRFSAKGKLYDRKYLFQPRLAVVFDWCSNGAPLTLGGYFLHHRGSSMTNPPELTLSSLPTVATSRLWGGEA